MRAIQALAIVGGSYLVSLFLAFVLVILTAGLTSTWGPSRAGTAMMAMLGGIAFVFLCAAIVVFLLLRSSVPAAGLRIAIVLGYGVILLLTLAGLAFVSAVLFDR